MKNVVFRQTFTDLPKHVNWFPGHMKKAMIDLESEIKKADMFLEVRDSRIPFTSHNEELLSMIPKSMKRIIIFNKIDLANEK
jgi:ribosome biogenesis GTPase A